MKLVITIIEDDDAPSLIDKLTENDFQATKLASSGGFLLQGNTTLLIGVEDDNIDIIIDIIKQTCVRRKKLIPHATSELPTAVNLPMEIEAGGATIFVVDVSNFYKL